MNNETNVYDRRALHLDIKSSQTGKNVVPKTVFYQFRRISVVVKDNFMADYNSSVCIEHGHAPDFYYLTSGICANFKLIVFEGSNAYNLPLKIEQLEAWRITFDEETIREVIIDGFEYERQLNF
jgi:hypothetical protein